MRTIVCRNSRLLNGHVPHCFSRVGVPGNAPGVALAQEDNKNDLGLFPNSHLLSDEN